MDPPKNPKRKKLSGSQFRKQRAAKEQEKKHLAGSMDTFLKRPSRSFTVQAEGEEENLESCSESTFVPPETDDITDSPRVSNDTESVSISQEIEVKSVDSLPGNSTS
ncbi:unnamed protein product, partial [Callosobruchus maculatus]